MTLRAFILGLAANFIAGGIIEHFKGPHAFLVSLSIGFVLLAIASFLKRVLVIHYAGYGIGPEQYQDVTTTLRGHIRDNKLNVLVNAETFNCDPYRGIKKHVFVKYSFGWWCHKEKIRNEDDRLTLP